MRDHALVVWVIGLLVIGIQSFYIPRGIVGTRFGRGRSTGIETIGSALSMRNNANMCKLPVPKDTSAIIEELTLARDQGNIDSFVHIHLKALADNKPQPLPEAVFALLESTVDSIEVRHLSRWMLALGVLGLRAGISKHRVLLDKSIDKLGSTGVLLPQDVGMFLKALHLTGLALSQLTDAQQAAVLRHIHENVSAMRPCDLSLTLMALSKIGVKWSTLSSTMQVLLWDAFVRSSSKQITSRDAAQFLKAFGDMQLDASKLPRSQLDAVFHVIKVGIRPGKGREVERSFQQICMTLLGLGSMKISHTMLPADVAATVENCLLRVLPLFHDQQQLSNAVYGLGLMGWPCDKIGTLIADSLDKILSSMQPQSLLMTLNGLAHTGAQWKDLQGLCTKLEKAVSSMLSVNNPQAPQFLANVLNSLGRMQAEYSSMDAVFQDDVQSAFVKLHRKLSSQGLANCVHGLGKMRANWAFLSADFHRCLIAAFMELHHTMSAQELSNFIHGLGNMRAPLQELPAPFRKAIAVRLESLSSDFIPQHTANILWGFANMASQWKELPTNTLEAVVVQTVRGMNGQGLSTTLKTLGAMLVTWEELSMEVIRAIAQACKDVALSMSALDVTDSLEGLAFMACDMMSPEFEVSTKEDRERLLLLKMILATVEERVGREDPNAAVLFL